MVASLSQSSATMAAVFGFARATGSKKAVD
jgi:hypothetical protein